jgi:hypothetical protein
VHASRKSSVAGLWSSAALVALLPSVAAAQPAVRYTPKFEDLKYVYATLPPVAMLKPGETLETNTFDAFGNAIKKPGDAMALVKGDNPLTGPFAIAGAEPGDTLVVKILELTVDSTKGVGAFAPGFGALNATNYTPMLHARSIRITPSRFRCSRSSGASVSRRPEVRRAVRSFQPSSAATWMRPKRVRVTPSTCR